MESMIDYKCNLKYDELAACLIKLYEQIEKVKNGDNLQSIEE